MKWTSLTVSALYSWDNLYPSCTLDCAIKSQDMPAIWEPLALISAKPTRCNFRNLAYFVHRIGFSSRLNLFDWNYWRSNEPWAPHRPSFLSAPITLYFSFLFSAPITYVTVFQFLSFVTLFITFNAFLSRLTLIVLGLILLAFQITMSTTHTDNRFAHMINPNRIRAHIIENPTNHEHHMDHVFSLHLSHRPSCLFKAFKL